MEAQDPHTQSQPGSSPATLLLTVVPVWHCDLLPCPLALWQELPPVPSAALEPVTCPPSLGTLDPDFSWAQASGGFLSCNRGAAASGSGNKQKVVKVNFSTKKCSFLGYKVLFSNCFPFDVFSLYLGQVLVWPARSGGLVCPWC